MFVSRERNRWLTSQRATGLAIILCIGHVFSAASVSKNFSTTYDEIAHITAGFVYWTAHDMRFQPENGNFPQRWCALPLLWMDTQEISPDYFAWPEGDVWAMGEAFFYMQGNVPAELLAAARGMIALLSGLLCWVIFQWSRSLFGRGGALISLGLVTFSPSILAHGGLATSDTAATLAFCLTLLTWWRLYHRISWDRLLLAGLAAGLLAVAKYSALLFAPIALLLGILRLAQATPLIGAWRDQRWRWSGGRKFAAIGVASLFSGLVAWTTIWGGYEFRFTPAPDPTQREFLIGWDKLFLESTEPERRLADGQPAQQDPVNFQPGIIQSFGRVALEWKILPEAYIHGLLIVDRYSRSRLAFFAGGYRNTGWWTFFPTAFLTKTTLVTLGFFSAGIIALFRHRRARRIAYRLAPLLILAVIYGTTILTSNLSIGHRHTLPLYPLVFIVAGAIGPLINRPWQWRIAVVGVLLQVMVSWTIRPYYLAYFNELIGGPRNAHRLFVDSSLDWGQDLPGLASWLTEYPDEQPFYLSYFGYGDPRHHGVDAIRMGDSYYDRHARIVPAAITGGTFGISATMLRRVYSPVRGPWSPSYEATYARLLAWTQTFATAPAGSSILDFDGSVMSEAAVTERLWTYEALQFGRLCLLLENIEPEENIGYSILIYRLTDEEVNTALYGDLHAVYDLIEKH